MSKSWRRLQAKIRSLQLKLGSDRSSVRSFPDLSVPKRSTPCTNSMHGSTAKKGTIPGCKDYPIGNLHKSGLQLITPGEDHRAYAGNKVLSS